jgi:anionic cell wall polymer biosynthesis LytR-Cps2A-Psr (LCP) family protein
LIRLFSLISFVVLVSCSSDTADDATEIPGSQHKLTSNSKTSTTSSSKTGSQNEDETFVVTDSTITLRNNDFPKPKGRVINIMVTGVDSRLGDNTMHADANHLVRFFLDSGCVEIISIPRDTYADAGFDDTTNLNKLTNVRANRGRNTYHKAISEITGVSPIHHWVEFGFSQAIGLLEILGYKENAPSTLRVLRSRQAYSAGDYQRVYNQGQFIRQAMLRNVKHADDMLGDLALRAALMIVDTDMSYDQCSTLLEALVAGGFSDDASRIWVRLAPSMITRMQTFSFDSANIVALNKQIEHRIKKLGLDSVKITEETYEARLNKLIANAEADTAKRPRNVIHALRRPFEQRAWLQVPDRKRRAQYCDRLCVALEKSYRKTKQQQSADRVRAYVNEVSKLTEGR